MLAQYKLTEVELGLVANLSVETADEARKLVPSLNLTSEVRRLGRWPRRVGGLARCGRQLWEVLLLPPCCYSRCSSRRPALPACCLPRPSASRVPARFVHPDCCLRHHRLCLQGRPEPLTDEQLDAMLREMATYREFE